MKRLAIPLALILPLGLTACVDEGLAAAEIGVSIAKAIQRAKTESPDDFQARAQIYAEMYCDLRQDKELDFETVRTAAIDAGAPEETVDTVKSLIDTVCPDG